jgi:hypothetical protein
MIARQIVIEVLEKISAVDLAVAGQLFILPRIGNIGKRDYMDLVRERIERFHMGYAPSAASRDASKG